jgi:hypothetical protein
MWRKFVVAQKGNDVFAILRMRDNKLVGNDRHRLAPGDDLYLISPANHLCRSHETTYWYIHTICKVFATDVY